MRRAATWLGLWIAGNIGSLPVYADVIYKTDGGRIVGVIQKDENSPNHVTIKTRFGTIRIPRGEIKDIQFNEPKGEDYEQAAKKFKDLPNEQYQLALWCQQNGFADEYTAHLKRVLELEPDHAEARKRLGFQNVNGEWKTRDQILESKGFVKHRGRYVLPQEKAELENRAERAKAEREFYQRIKGLRHRLHDDDPTRRQSAMRELERMDDAAAIKPVFELLWKRGDATERPLAVQTLARIDDAESTTRLLTIALEDDDSAIRAAAAESLVSRKSPNLLQQTAMRLRDRDNNEVRNAATILAVIGDATIVPELVAALVTKHTYIVQESLADQVRRSTVGGGLYRPGVTYLDPSTGKALNARQMAGLRPAGGGFSVGQPDKQVIVEERKNPEVLSALRALTEQDFGYDKDRWLRWIRDNYREKSAKLKN